MIRFGFGQWGSSRNVQSLGSIVVAVVVVVVVVVIVVVMMRIMVILNTSTTTLCSSFFQRHGDTLFVSTVVVTVVVPLGWRHTLIWHGRERRWKTTSFILLPSYRGHVVRVLYIVVVVVVVIVIVVSRTTTIVVIIFVIVVIIVHVVRMERTTTRKRRMVPATVDGVSFVSCYCCCYFEESVGFRWLLWLWLFFVIVIIMRRRDFGNSHHLRLKFGARAPMRRTSFLGFAIVVVVAATMTLTTAYHHWRHDGMQKE